MSTTMDRRTFLKTTAAAAVAVSLTGLLGGCNEPIGTDFGNFQAAVGKWRVKPHEPGIGFESEKWYADFQVELRLKETSGTAWNMNATQYFQLTVNGTPLVMQGGDLLASNKMLYFKKNELKVNWLHFQITEENKALYKAIEDKTADIRFMIYSIQAKETYTAEYPSRTFVKDPVA